MTTRRNVILSLLAGAAMMGLGGCGPLATPTPSTGLSVTTTISAVTLADDCPSSARGVAADCAEPPASADAGAGLIGGCGICRQSSMQLLVAAGRGTGSARIEVMLVRLVDATTGASVDTLTAREPQAWDELTSTYRPWDQTVAQNTTLRVSYKLSAPRWGGANDRLAYTRRYRLEVVLSVDGVARTVRSSDVTREPEIVT